MAADEMQAIATTATNQCLWICKPPGNLFIPFLVQAKNYLSPAVAQTGNCEDQFPQAMITAANATQSNCTLDMMLVAMKLPS
jgi:hypothetical protein